MLSSATRMHLDPDRSLIQDFDEDFYFDPKIEFGDDPEMIVLDSCPGCGAADPFEPADKDCTVCLDARQCAIDLAEIGAGWDPTP